MGVVSRWNAGPSGVSSIPTEVSDLKGHYVKHGLPFILS